MKHLTTSDFATPKIVDRAAFQAELDALRLREKAHTKEGDAIAAARRRLPMVEVDGATPLTGEREAVTLLDVFEGRRMLIAYYFMWHAGRPGAGAMRGVHLLHVAGPRAVLYSFPRRHLRHVLPRPVPRRRPLPRLHGLDDAVVLGGEERARNALGRTPGRHDAHRLLPATRIACLRDVLDDEARRRGDGQQLPPARPDRLWAAGDVGGLARRLATTAGRRARLPDRRASHCPMAAPEGRLFRRPGNRQALRGGRVRYFHEVTAGMKRAFGNDRGAAARVAANWLCLAATPTFAIMALLTAVGGGEPEFLCAAMPHASPLSGMILMYLLMSGFHSAPWLKLICGRREAITRDNKAASHKGWLKKANHTAALHPHRMNRSAA
jgi:Bacterial protein of unknown function (DUF899)